MIVVMLLHKMNVLWSVCCLYRRTVIPLVGIFTTMLLLKCGWFSVFVNYMPIALQHDQSLFWVYVCSLFCELVIILNLWDDIHGCGLHSCAHYTRKRTCPRPVKTFGPVTPPRFRCSNSQMGMLGLILVGVRKPYFLLVCLWKIRP